MATTAPLKMADVALSKTIISRGDYTLRWEKAKLNALLQFVYLMPVHKEISIRLSVFRSAMR